MYGDGEVIGQVGDVYDDFCIVAQVRFRSKNMGSTPTVFQAACWLGQDWGSMLGMDWGSMLLHPTSGEWGKYTGSHSALSFMASGSVRHLSQAPANLWVTSIP